MLPIRISLPEDFLKEEDRCGYTVSKEMKEVWAIELDLLVEFMRVCQKHDLKWWMDGGSLLGTIRHRGFIPWDDDIDVIMFRRDYDKLCQVAPSEFKHPYFFQTELTDHSSLRGHAQIRNSQTSAIRQIECQYKFHFNQGICMDVFPLDSIPDDQEKFDQQLIDIKENLQKCYELRNSIEFGWKRKRTNFLFMWANRFRSYLYNGLLYDLCGTGHYYKAFEASASRYSNVDTKHVGNLILGNFKQSWKWLREDYRDTCYKPFEFLSVPVPVGFESRLNIQYGDWHKIVKGTSLHGEVLYDTRKSYIEYVKKQ